MFGWLNSPEPLDAPEKNWIEERLLWLMREFGEDKFLWNPVILPTSEFFAARWDGSGESVAQVFLEVCNSLNVPPANVHLEIFEDSGPFQLVNEQGDVLPNALGQYEPGAERATIHLGRSTLADRSRAIQAMAHELAHVRLIQEGRLTEPSNDSELLASLTALFHGLGIFVANSRTPWHRLDVTWPGSTLRMPGAMTPPMYGYALAHAVWLRHEPNPTWTKWLRLEIRTCLAQSLRYLRDTGNSRLKRCR